MSLTGDEKNILGGAISEQALNAAEKLITAAHEGRQLEYPTVQALHDLGALDAALTCVLALIMEKNNERAAAILAQVVDGLRTLDAGNLAGLANKSGLVQ